MAQELEIRPHALLAQLESTGNLTPAGLILPADITPERYEAIGTLLYAWGEGWRWAVGDWLIQGHGIFGDAFYQYSEVLNLSVRMRQYLMQVAEGIPPGPRRRVPELTWSHHRATCMLEPKECDKWLQKAIDKGWTKQQLEDEMRGKVPPPPEPAFLPTGYVVERVLSAAEQVYASARRSDTAEYYLVESRALHNLADALGVDGVIE